MNDIAFLQEDISNDFKNYVHIIAQNFHVQIAPQHYAALRIIHQTMYLVNSYSHDAFFGESENLPELQRAFVNLANRAVVCAMQGDMVFISFALRGCLDLSGAQLASFQNIKVSKKYSNNLEGAFSKVKQRILLPR